MLNGGKRHTHFVFSRQEYDTLCAKAKQCGLSRSAYLRRLIMDKPIKARPPEAIRDLYVEINRIGVNINQMPSSGRWRRRKAGAICQNGSWAKSLSSSSRISRPELLQTIPQTVGIKRAKRPNRLVPMRTRRFLEKVNTAQELADAAGIGRNTMNKVIQINEHAPEVIKKALDNKEISVNMGYELTRKLQDVPEEDRETAAAILLEAEKEYKERNAQTDRKGRIAKQICTAFEKRFLM